MKNKSSEIKKNLVYDLQNTNEYEPKKINWKKVIIILTILASIVTGIVCIWLFVFKGKEFIDYRNKAKKVYTQLLQEHDIKKVENFQYYNNELKESTKKMVEEVDEIYKDGGFEMSWNNKKYSNMKYGYDELQTATFGKYDYLLQFINKDKAIPDNLSSFNKQETANPYPRYFSSQVQIRIVDGKIAGIYFVRSTEILTNKSTPFAELPGSMKFVGEGH